MYILSGIINSPSNHLAGERARERECVNPLVAQVRCFLTSTEIPVLLSLVLAFGNYLNGSLDWLDPNRLLLDVGSKNGMVLLG